MELRGGIFGDETELPYGQGALNEAFAGVSVFRARALGCYLIHSGSQRTDETRETRGAGPGVQATGPDACWIVSPGRGIGAVAQSTSSEADGGGVAETPSTNILSWTAFITAARY